MKPAIEQDSETAPRVLPLCGVLARGVVFVAQAVERSDDPERQAAESSAECYRRVSANANGTPPRP